LTDAALEFQRILAMRGEERALELYFQEAGGGR